MNNFNPALQQFLTYVATKSHTLNLDQHTFTRVLAEECGDVLLAFRDVFLERELDIAFLIAWNDLRKHWNESTPFLTSPIAKKSILKYMALKGRLEIAGSTQFVFDRRSAPAFVVIFSLGDDFAIASELKDGLDILRVTLPISSGVVPETYRDLLDDEFDEESIKCSQPDIGGARLLSIGQITDKDGKTSFHKRTSAEVKGCGDSYRSFLTELTCRLSEPNAVCIPNGDDLVKLHESLALIYPLLRETGPDRELAYLFNSANIYASFDAYTDELKDGGCMCVMGPKQNMCYPELYIGASLAFSRFSAAQKRFRIYFERLHAVRSAVAAIMARNMSHNIGSHALWYRAEALDRGEKLHSRKSGSFVRYLQKRMDFIAHIATSSPAWCLSTKWWKLCAGIERQAFLLDNIARSEKITGAKLQVKWREEDNNVRMNIPHAAIGAQAFYSIFENLIRNAAKSGNPDELRRIREDVSGKERLTFDVRIESTWDDQDTGWEQDYCRVTIRDSLTTSQAVVDELNTFLQRTIVEKETQTGTHVPGQWGMKEIKICASYLRMVRQENLDAVFDELKDGRGDGPPIIRAELENITPTDNGITGNLTYVLYLSRPKEAMLVGTDVAATGIDRFAAAGIDVTDTWEGVKRTMCERKILTHQFLLGTSDGLDLRWLRNNINYLPRRILICGQLGDPLPKELANRVVIVKDCPTKEVFGDEQGVLDYLWEQWTQYWWSDLKLAMRADAARKKEHVAEVFFEETDDPFRSDLLLFDHKRHPDADGNKAFASCTYHECFSKGDGMDHLLTGGAEPRTQWYLKESAALKIGILDERVSEPTILSQLARCGSDKLQCEKNKRIQEAWSKRRVWISDAEDAMQDFRRFVDQLESTHEQFDFFIIHQGIIDRIKKSDEVGFQEAWDHLNNFVRWLIIDTGRGRPEQAAEDGLCWVEYSNFSDVVIHRAGDKYALTQLLFSLKPEPRIDSLFN